MTTDYVVRAISPAVVAQLRRFDDARRPPRLSIDAEGGAPLRCCLRRSEPGEALALVSYAPLRRWAAGTGADPGPYDEVGPVFIHAEQCAGPADARFPAHMHAGPRVLRAYDGQGRILRGELVQVLDAGTADAVAGELFADPAVAVVHVRAVGFGCFMHELQRV
ncbi:hypothetical protein Cs7R123_11670 [Catellatospora sp. TT07R-123]|uniref:DUF1203 domain-containing protein n=1 Tax=Catellatospora sp. TT07R-123 TaxID=2733863 RepID=UPI001B27E13D|nr:DUF1203 domain-containing protein [Catellatospora sp. TT07R-123]GHJ43825.1 hypothetical protein Cs7R123_11670 [Catellatospora sp. TT07R-123]